MLALTDRLRAGSSYTLTFRNGETVNLSSDSEVQADLSAHLGELGMGEVTEVSRALFSDRYAVTVLPAVDMPLRDLVEAFAFVWPLVGFAGATFLLAEPGFESSSPGGVSELLPDVGTKVGETVSSTITATLKPLAPYLVAGAVLFALVVFWPRLAAGRA